MNEMEKMRNGLLADMNAPEIQASFRHCKRLLTQMRTRSTYDNDWLSAGYVLILGVLIFVVTRLFVDVCPYFQVYEHIALACVYATFQHPDMCYRP